MNAKLALVAGALLAVSTSASAQMPPLNFDQAAYITCRQAHDMAPEPRKMLAVYLADHASRYRGIVIPDNEVGAQIAHLIRGGCTLAPDAYLFTVIDRAIVAEMSKLPKRK